MNRVYSAVGAALLVTVFGNMAFAQTNDQASRTWQVGLLAGLGSAETGAPDDSALLSGSALEGGAWRMDVAFVSPALVAPWLRVRSGLGYANTVVASYEEWPDGAEREVRVARNSLRLPLLLHVERELHPRLTLTSGLGLEADIGMSSELENRQSNVLPANAVALRPATTTTVRLHGDVGVSLSFGQYQVPVRLSYSFDPTLGGGLSDRIANGSSEDGALVARVRHEVFFLIGANLR